MEILLFHPWIKSKGGAEKLIYEYIKRSKNKFMILSWLYIKETSLPFNNIISTFPKSFERIYRSYLLRGAFSLLSSQLKIEDDYDLVLISTSGIGELILLRNNFKVPVVGYVHTPLRASYYWDIIWNLKYRFANYPIKLIYKIALHSYDKLEKKAWKKIDFSIFNSELSKKRALDKKLIDENKTKIIYPGVDLKNLYYEEPGDYFLYISRYGMAKRQDILIKAFAKFSKEYKDYKLILAGGLENKKYYIYLLKLIKKYNLQDKVKIMINLPYEKIIELYAKSLAFVHIPFMEDFGIAPLEAAAAGKFIINTYPSGNYEILKDAPGIYWIKEKLYKEKMIEEVYNALKYFINNKDELIEKGKENRRFIKEKDLSWDRFTKELDETLENFIK
ncbi:glycosyl transferase [Nanoarchaeota archaeon]